MSPRSQDIRQAGLFGFLAQPDAPTKAGVVMLPTIFGVNAFMRDYAETLARAGIAAGACDHYEGMPLTTDYEESKRRMRNVTDPKMHANAKAWVDYMLDELKLASIGVIGFCIGGRYALMVAARDQRIRACGAAYPSIDVPRLAHQDEDALARAADIACPVLVLQPGHDHVAQPQTYATLKSTLTSRATPTIWHYYPDAEHGFMHRGAPPANPAANAMASPQLVGFLQGCLLAE
jgi:carboxymethylenebutenolidase